MASATGVESGSSQEAERDMMMWKEEKEEQQTPLKLLTLLHDLSPPRCESHMFGGEGGGGGAYPTQQGLRASAKYLSEFSVNRQTWLYEQHDHGSLHHTPDAKRQIPFPFRNTEKKLKRRNSRVPDLNGLERIGLWDVLPVK